MAKRIKLCDRALPTYSTGEEWMNTITHGLGALLGIAALVLCLVKAGNAMCVVASAIYGASMITLYTMSSVYHGLRPGMAKKVMQVIDHCTIYFLIAGSYTAVVLTAMVTVYPALAWGLFIFEWALALLAATLTAIDLKKYSIFSMICYIGMGWAVIPFWRQAMDSLRLPGFLLLLFGGIAYTIGSVLYGIGRHKKWMHSLFHIFVLLGSALQFFSIFLYALE